MLVISVEAIGFCLTLLIGVVVHLFSVLVSGPLYDVDGTAAVKDGIRKLEASGLQFLLFFTACCVILRIQDKCREVSI